MKSTHLVRTVLGDIDPAQLGICYSHEHVIIDPSYMTEKYPEYLIDSVDRAVLELKQFKANGGDAMIDSMPAGGRNAAKLAEVSQQSGVHIVCPTGLHLKKYYPPGRWEERLSVDELAEVFVGEIEEGIDGNDLNGPVLKRLPQRAGLIKIATSQDHINEYETRVFEAAAEAHRRTGCPIITHTEQGMAALEQVALLAKFGANLRHVTLSHTDRKPDFDYHREILRSGVKVEYDQAFRWKKGNPTLDLVITLAPEFPSQIMLGMDAARRAYWKSYGGGPGLSYLLTDFRKQLQEAGLSEELWKRMMITNPAETFSFATN